MKPFNLIALALILLGNSAFAQREKQSQPNIQSPFSLTIAGPAECKSGEEIEISFRVTNTSDHDIDMSTVYRGGVDLGFRYEVHNSKGQLLEAAKVPRLAISPIQYTLAPGRTMEGGTTISRLFTMTKPGRYEIRMSRVTSGDVKAPVVMSNKLTINVE